MTELILGFLIITIALAGLNAGFLIGKKKFNNKKAVICIFSTFFIFLLLNILLNNSFKFLNSYLDILFIIVSIFLIIMAVLFVFNYKKEISSDTPLILAVISLLILAILLKSQIENNNIDNLINSLVFIFTGFLSYFLSKLLIHAKRPFSLLISELIILESIFFFLLGLTYDSIGKLNYNMFKSFLILTPTYQLLYIIIGCLGLLLAGAYFNDRKMRFNK